MMETILPLIVVSLLVLKIGGEGGKGWGACLNFRLIGGGAYSNGGTNSRIYDTLTSRSRLRGFRLLRGLALNFIKSVENDKMAIY